MKYSLPLRAGWLIASVLLACSVRAEELFDAEGYRSSQYRSPTPITLEGVQVVDTPRLQQLLEQQPRPLLIDVYRRPWVHDRFVEDSPHANLPGSLWLANTGDGNLAPLWQSYFRYHLKQASDGDRQFPVVFYCRSDCWLSWNAARRALAMGYTRLYWYRDGIDAWEQAGLPLVHAEPAELPAALLPSAVTP